MLLRHAAPLKPLLELGRVAGSVAPELAPRACVAVALELASCFPITKLPDPVAPPDPTALSCQPSDPTVPEITRAVGSTTADLPCLRTSLPHLCRPEHSFATVSLLRLTPGTPTAPGLLLAPLLLGCSRDDGALSSPAPPTVALGLPLSTEPSRRWIPPPWAAC